MCAPRGQSWDEEQTAKYGLFAHLGFVARMNSEPRIVKLRKEFLKELQDLLLSKTNT